MFLAMTLCDSMEEAASCILGCVLRLWQQAAPSAVLSVTAVQFSDKSIPSTNLCSVIPQDYIILECTIMRDLKFCCVCYFDWIILKEFWEDNVKMHKKYVDCEGRCELH